MDDDQLWLDALAGRPSSGSASPAAREAEVLRAAILAQKMEEPTPVPAEDPSREQALLARARQAGLLGAARCETRSGRSGDWRGWFVGWRGGFAFAALLCVAIAVGLLMPSAPEETVRSAPGGMVRIEAKDPLKLQRQILDQLRGAGIQPTGYEQLGLWGIDADLPQPIPPAVKKVLDQHRIPLPADGVLRVEFAPVADKR